MGWVLYLVGALVAAPPSVDTVLQRSADWARALAAAPSVRYRVVDAKQAPAGDLTIERGTLGGTARPNVDDPALALWAELLRAPDEATLARAGIRTGLTSWYRHHRRVVVVVGADDPLDDVSQVWFDFETGAPVVVYLANGSRGATMRGGPLDRPGTHGLVPSRLSLVRGHTAILTGSR